MCCAGSDDSNAWLWGKAEKLCLQLVLLPCTLQLGWPGSYAENPALCRVLFCFSWHRSETKRKHPGINPGGKEGPCAVLAAHRGAAGTLVPPGWAWRRSVLYPTRHNTTFHRELLPDNVLQHTVNVLGKVFLPTTPGPTGTQGAKLGFHGCNA